MTSAPSSPPPARGVRSAPSGRPAASLQQWAGLLVVLAVAVALWLPRLSGPLDLRFDAGVYYVLGTSLANGDGYRIMSEPGAPEGIQYPPLLPLLVAAHQWLLGSSDPAMVAPWLRVTFAALFVLYAAAVYQLGLRWLPAPWAVTAAVMCLLSAFTFFLSDLLFTEIPFALVSVAFVLLASRPETSTRPFRRDALVFVLGCAAFFLRSAGLALFAAWALEALVQRRWRAAAVRAGLAFLPFAAWQGHILRVERSDEYQEPAYAYQRAPYQFYNVSYGTNLALKDPFRPELGKAGPVDLIRRVSANAVLMPQAMAESISLQRGYWRNPIGRVQLRLFGSRFLLDPLSWVPVLALMVTVCAGIVVLFYRRVWLIGGVIVASVGLVCLTPWPGQFLRYLSPLTPFLSIGALLALHALTKWVRARSPSLRRTVLGATAVLLGATVLAQAWYARRLHQVREEDGHSYVSEDQPIGPRFFFHDEEWREWERSVEWVRENAPADAIVATSSPHLLYLRTGRLSVMPPMEDDPARALELLEGVPVSHVIIDNMKFIDISRRYALPALESAPDRWQVVHENGGARVYARVGGEAGSGPAPDQR